MKLTAQQMQQLESCSSAEEIMTLAKKANIDITMEQAQKAFDLLKSENIPDDWLDQVAGGFCNICKEQCINAERPPCSNHRYWSWK